MREVQMILVRNNANDQYTSYNYPLLPKVSHVHMKHLRVFEQMVARHQAQVQTIAKAKRISEEEAQQVLLASQRKKPKKGQLVNVLQKCVYSEYSYAMVNCE